VKLTQLFFAIDMAQIECNLELLNYVQRPVIF